MVINVHATHLAVRGRTDPWPLDSRIDARCPQTLAMRNVALQAVAGDARRIEENRAVGKAPAFIDLLLDAQRHASLLDPLFAVLRVVAKHEPLALGVDQASAVAQHSRRHLQTTAFLRPYCHDRLELYELHVHKPRPDIVGEGV